MNHGYVLVASVYAVCTGCLPHLQYHEETLTHSTSQPTPIHIMCKNFGVFCSLQKSSRSVSKSLGFLLVILRIVL
ncbi:hypothetical protein TNCV_1935121 [Trichonephila clavipes]|nr:hypothetical protein TNCV_1935121 [Trichonephila clavipes]